MTFFDTFFGPLYFGIFFLIIQSLKKKLTNDEVERNLYTKAFLFKIFGATLFILIYQFYYGGGDAIGFYAWTKRLTQYFIESPGDALSFLSSETEEEFYKFRYSGYVEHYGYLLKYGTRETSFIKMMFPINLLCFNSILAIGYFLATITFICNWLFYKVFAKYFPAVKKQLIYASLFIPTVAFWSGGILKDTITYAGICLLVHAFHKALILKESFIKNLIIILLTLNIVVLLRGFVVLALLPAFSLWAFSNYSDKIKNQSVKYLATPFLIILGLGTAYIMFTLVGNQLGRFSVSDLDQTIKDFQGWHQVASADGSGYTLSVAGSSVLDMIKTFPAAINVTFFRPYLWEASGIVVLFSAIESLFVFLYFIKILFKSKFIGFFNAIFSNSLVQMCMVFALLYGFSVGFTSYNFGALSRYKIPAMPFFLVALVMISDLVSNPKASFKKRQ